jgi:hypothetical protein
MRYIQTGLQETNRSKKGIHHLVNLNNMVLDEFSKDNLEASLDRITKEYKSNSSFYNFRLNNNPKRVISVLYFEDTSSESRKDIMECINSISNNVVKTAQPTYLNEFFISGSMAEPYNNFYWDVENDFMFWESKDGSFGKKLLHFFSERAKLLNKEKEVA